MYHTNVYVFLEYQQSIFSILDNKKDVIILTAIRLEVVVICFSDNIFWMLTHK